ncbi:hypothetical protein D3C75_941230 [compost metagenome]
MRRAGQRVLVDQCLQARLEIAPGVAGVVPQAFFLHHIQHRHADAATDRAAAGRGEEVALGLQRFGDLAAGDDYAQWLAVAHALGHGDDVGHHPLLLEAPEVLTQAAIAHLHFIGDAHTAAGTDLGIRLFQVTRRQRDATGVAINRLADHAGQLTATGIEVGELGIDVT